MTIATTKLRCSNCENAVVTTTCKETEAHVSWSVSKCDTCKKEYGIKAAGKLTEIEI